MQRLVIVGNLTADPVSKTTQAGKTVCNFTVAVNRRQHSEGQPEADFFRIGAWGKIGENCQKYLFKGKKVSVVGTVSARAYTDSTGAAKASMEVLADDVEFLSANSTGTEHSQSAPQTEPQQGGFTAVETDELPF